MRRLVCALLAGVGLTGCADCGDFTYRGYTIEEHCGIVYGTQGVWYRDQERVVLQLGSSTPIERTGITFRPDEPVMTIGFPDTWLERGAEIPVDELTVQCRYPGGATATVDEVEVTVGGPGLKPDPMNPNRYRRFTWHLSCDGGELVSSASDVVELVLQDG